MALRTNLRAALPVLFFVGASTVSLFGQSAFSPQGGEYRIAGQIPGDQVNSRIALSPAGGYLVWQDNFIDGDGLGIGALKLGPSFNGEFSPVKINLTTAGNQENPDVSLLSDGGAAIVWQGDTGNTRAIYAQFMAPDGTLRFTSDLAVSSSAGGMKIQPKVAGLPGGGAVVTWGSFQQDDAANFDQVMARMQGVYARIIGPTGSFVTSEFQVNQTTRYNQRNPGVVSLSDGRLAFVWVTEAEQTIIGDGLGVTSATAPVHIFGRLFSATGSPLGNEFKINTSVTNICAQPSITARADGGFSVVWSERDLGNNDNSWDIEMRAYNADGTAIGGVQPVNSFLYGDQLSGAITSAGNEQLAVWTSLAQDGSFEGIYGQFFSGAQKLGNEFRVNTTTVSRQMLPAVAGVGDVGFVATWSSFVGGDASMDLFAQRYLLSVPKPAAPIVSAINQNQLSVTWPTVEGFDVATYEVYESGNATAVAITTNNWWDTPQSLLPSTQKSYQIAYRLQDGRLSPLSDAGSGRTWGADNNFDGLPDDWEQMYFGSNPANWPAANADSDGDGATNLQEFLAGTNPADPTDSLKISLNSGVYGWTATWNTKPGLIYKLQTSTDFKNWSDVGGARFAIGTQDSEVMNNSGGLGYFRVLRIR